MGKWDSLKWRQTLARRGLYVSPGPRAGGVQAEVPNVFCRRKFSFKEYSWGRKACLYLIAWRRSRWWYPFSVRTFVILSILRNKNISLFITYLARRLMPYLLPDDLIQHKYSRRAKQNSFLAWGWGHPRTLPSLPLLQPFSPWVPPTFVVSTASAWTNT